MYVQCSLFAVFPKPHFSPTTVLKLPSIQIGDPTGKRVSKATLKKKVEKQMKEKYFTALIRAFENSVAATKCYRQSLERKVVTSLKTRVQFVAMKG